MSQMTQRRYGIAWIAALSLTACVSGFESRAPVTDVYVLRPTIEASRSLQDLRVQILPVRVRSGYATEAILRSGPDRTLDVLAASRWPDALPRMWEGLLVDGLKSSGFGDVLEPLSSARADWLIQVVIRRFDLDETRSGERAVRIEMDVTVMDRTRRESRLSFAVEAQVPVIENRMRAIIAAFEQASTQILTDIALRLGESDWRQAAGS